jgi:glycosyltransferase involved in cell wall biosynthesis
MRIAVLSDLLRANGANIMAATHARILHDVGDEVIMVSGGSADPDIASILEGIPTTSFMLDDYPLDSVVGEPRARLSADIEGWLLEAITRFSPDVVICHNIGRLLNQVGVARLSRLVPTIVVLHDEWFVSDAHYVAYATGETEMSYEPHTPKSLREHDFSALWRMRHEVGDLVAVAPSRWLQREWQTVHPSLPCLCIPNPIDPELFVPHDRREARLAIGLDPDISVIGFVGHPTVKRKGFDLLAAAVDHMKSDVVVLVAGGAAPYVPRSLESQVLPRGMIRERLDQNRTEPTLPGAALSTLVLGPVPRHEFAAVMSSFDLLVHPSRVDNLPTVPIEAQYCGVPCLVSDVGGSDETTVDERSTFDPCMSSAELARVIGDRLGRARQESSADRFRRRERSLARFSPEVHLSRLRPVLAEVAGSR